MSTSWRGPGRSGPSSGDANGQLARAPSRVPLIKPVDADLGSGSIVSLSKTGRTVWTIQLRRGTYRFRCDPHRALMHGSFRVA